MSTEEAVKKTLEEMPDDFVIKPFLVANKEAVTNSFLTEYDEKLHIENEKNISYEEGRAEERINTEREKRRADKAEEEMARLKEETERLKEEINKLKQQVKANETI